MLVSIYHMTLKLLNHIFGENKLRLCHNLHIIVMTSLHKFTKYVNHQWFVDFNARPYITYM